MTDDMMTLRTLLEKSSDADDVGDRHKAGVPDRGDRIAVGAVGEDLVVGDGVALEIGYRELEAPLPGALGDGNARAPGCEEKRADERRFAGRGARPRRATSPSRPLPRARASRESER